MATGSQLTQKLLKTLPVSTMEKWHAAGALPVHSLRFNLDLPADASAGVAHPDDESKDEMWQQAMKETHLCGYIAPRGVINVVKKTMEETKEVEEQEHKYARPVLLVLQQMQIAPRGHGIGWELLETLLAWARETHAQLGVDGVCVECLSHTGFRDKILKNGFVPESPWRTNTYVKLHTASCFRVQCYDAAKG